MITRLPGRPRTKCPIFEAMSASQRCRRREVASLSSSMMHRLEEMGAGSLQSPHSLVNLNQIAELQFRHSLPLS